MHFCLFLNVCVGLTSAHYTSCICRDRTMHVILFVCHYFHTHSLSTGRCLWRSDLRSDLSSFFTVFVLSLMSFPSPLPLSCQLQFTTMCWSYLSLKWNLSSFYCYPRWKAKAHDSCLQSSTGRRRQFGGSQFISPGPPFKLFLLNVLCFCVLLKCFVVCVSPCDYITQDTRESHPVNTHFALHFALFLCLRYHQHQHRYRGHCWLCPLPRPDSGSYSLVL